MTGQTIIDNFNTWTNNASELSDTELLALAEKAYRSILNERDWYFLFKTATGTLSTSVPYIALPSDYAHISANKDGDSVIYVGSAYTPYYLVPYQERRKYLNLKEYVYDDPVNSRLVFTSQPTVADSYEFDYIHIPVALTLNTSTVFRDDWGWAVVHKMVVDFFAIDQTEKGRSYYAENLLSFETIMEQMRVEDFRRKVNL